MVQKDALIPLARPFITEDSLKGAIEVIESGHLVQGKKVDQLEAELASYLNVKHCLLLSSGTAALYAALIALKIGPGDEVIIPAFTFIATANVVEAVGATPVLVDIDINSFNIDPGKIEAKITSKTKAIMPVHEFGQAADMQRINSLAQKHHLHIIEDAACALGTVLNNKMVGVYGIVGCFSFHPRKIITTAEGGMLVTDDDGLAAKVSAFRNHGIEIKDGKIDTFSWGLNLRLTDIQAAIGLPQLPVLNDYLKNRTALAKLYNHYLKDVPGIVLPPFCSNGSHTYQTYHLLLDNRFNREQVKEALLKQNIQTNLGAQAIHMLTFYREKYRLKSDDFPHAKQAYTQGLALPIGHHINEETVAYISQKLNNVLNEINPA